MSKPETANCNGYNNFMQPIRLCVGLANIILGMIAAYHNDGVLAFGGAIIGLSLLWRYRTCQKKQ